MSRVAMTGLLIAALLAGAPGIGNAITPALPSVPASPWSPVDREKIVEVTGILIHDLDHGPVHYKLNEYVLLGVEAERLAPLVGRGVVVKGIILTGMSLYMRPLLQVKEITPKNGVVIPVEPRYRLLFGTLVTACSDIYLLEWGGASWIQLEGLGLTHLVGQPVALAGDLEIRADGTRVYHVHEALSVGVDLAPYLGTIYQEPARPITVTMAGQPVTMSREPIMANGRTLVELRALAEAMNAPIHWDAATRQVTVRRGDRQVILSIGSPRVIIREGEAESTTFATDVAPVLVGGRTMVPIRVLADGLGLKVAWDSTNWTVQIA